MKDSLNQNEMMILDSLLAIPPKYEDAERRIRASGISPIGITKIAICYASKCFGDASDHFAQQLGPDEDICSAAPPQGIFPGLHSTYIYDVVKFLLGFGLDPNAVIEFEYGHYNIMQELLFIDNEFLGSDTLALLLEHGGDPNLSIDDETLLESIVFDVWFGSVEQEVRWRYAQTVHNWMVLTGCGGKYRDDYEWPRVFKGYDENNHYGKLFDLSLLKNHRDFFFGLSFEEGCRTLHIYDKKTFWKVAEWR